MRTVSHLKVNLRDKVARAAVTLDARRELVNRDEGGGDFGCAARAQALASSSRSSISEGFLSRLDGD